jgi:putative NADH-flavin reductase
MRSLPVYASYAAALSGAFWQNGVRNSSGQAAAAPGPKPASVLIVGATGGTGRELVTQALERGYLVTALARDPAAVQINQINNARLRVVQGDVLDYPSLESAVKGHEAVLCALGHKQYFRPTHILSKGTGNLLRAMNAQGVRRLVCETALGIGSSAGRMGLYYTFFVLPIILPFYFWDKTRQEQAIAASLADWVIVRPGALTDGARRGRYRHGADIGSFLMTVRISRADVADFMLNQLTDNTYLKAAPGVCW